MMDSSLKRQRTTEADGEQAKKPVAAAVSLKAIPSSIFSGSIPRSDLTLQILDFLAYHINGTAASKIAQLAKDDRFQSSGIEIEAKLGCVIDKAARSRLNLPIGSETVVNNSMNEFAFESDMDKRQHASFNQMLNSHVNAASGIKYVHTKEVDEFITVRGLGKIRRTFDEKTRNVLACINKIRVADLDLFLPSHPYDIRISINIEAHLIDHYEENVAETSRAKDRVSYSLHPFQVDLTQVRNMGGNTDGVVTHEIEVEFTDASEFVEKLKTHSVGANPSSRLVEYIEGFLGNIRTLARHEKKS